MCRYIKGNAQKDPWHECVYQFMLQRYGVKTLAVQNLWAVIVASKKYKEHSVGGAGLKDVC